MVLCSSSCCWETPVHASLVLAAGKLQPAGKEADCPVTLCLAIVQLWKRVPMVLQAAA